jgi:NADH:ubiquinone oxidoreductase subunit 3 (subunit A)
MEARPLQQARATQTRRLLFRAVAGLAGLAALVIVPRLTAGSSPRSADTGYEHKPSTFAKRSTQVGERYLTTPTERSIIMLIRYFSWLVVGLAAVFLVVASASFSSLAAIAWLAFAISIGTMVVATGIAYRYRDHLPTLVTAIVTAVVSAWTILASLVFSQPTVQSLAFAGSLAIAGLALAGLTTNELASEHVIHSLEMSEDRHDSRLAAAA